MTNTQQDQSTPPPIPPLASVAPAIFVPITDDLLAPFTQPPNRLALLQAKIEALDTHSAQVREIIVDLFSRERTRLLREGRRQDTLRAGGGGGGGGDEAADLMHGGGGGAASEDDIARMIADMSTPFEPGLEAHVVTSEVMTPALFSGLVARSPREWTAIELMRLALQASVDMEGYEAHVRQIRSHLERLLRQEQEHRAP